jgi:hypothetical protein
VATIVTIAAVVGVTLWQLHPNLLLSGSTTTGGDTGAHYMMPAYFTSHLFPHLTGWDPSWYDGYPDYTFYFVLPDALVALASHIISYNVAFKLATVLGSVLLPVAAWAMGRLFGLRPPVPAVLAAATLPFLFTYSYTIYGGNLFSTLAGEYAYSLSLSLALVFLGLFARGVRTGRHRGWAAVVLALCILAHIVPGMFALVGAALLIAIELLPERLRFHDRGGRPSSWATRPPEPEGVRGRGTSLWWGVSTVGLGLLLSGWWLVPFGVFQPYSTTMNYANVTTYVAILFPVAAMWALVLAGLGVIVALVTRSRFGLVVAALGGLSALGLIVDPQGSLYNVRLLPLWFMCVYLLAGWVFAVTVAGVARWVRRERLARWVALVWDGGDGVTERGGVDPAVVAGATAIGDGGADERGEDGSLPERFPTPPAWPRAGVYPRRPRPPLWAPGAVAGPLLALLGVLVVVVTPFVPASAGMLSDLGITPGANQVTAWAQWNYSGYEAKAAYPEYHALVRLMTHVGHRYGCGRAMWEYTANQNRFGTPEALMLLPYWTGGCVDSMEGLLFESSATTPYHFLNQAELSPSPSEAVVGLPYGTLDVPLGIKHLQLLGVRYFMAFSPEVEQEAADDPSVHLVATTGPWSSEYDGQTLSTTWDIYTVKQSSVVTPLTHAPAVLSGVGPSQSTWLGTVGPSGQPVHGPSVQWYDDPSRWGVELTAGGPSSWPRVSASGSRDPPKVKVPANAVSQVHQTSDSISFQVSRLHTPVLVKISYFPNWHASGAEGPWRATPNLMVVVPTSHHVTLTYGTTHANVIGDACTFLGLVALVALGFVALRRRASAPAPPWHRS